MPEPPRDKPPGDDSPSLRPTEAFDAGAEVAGPSSGPPGSGTTDFGDYELLREIGRGGMGVVYLARQKSLDRIVALKMILGSRLASRSQVSRFHAEARAAAGLAHPGVVKVFDAGEIDGHHYFAMEHVKGRGLDALIHRDALDIDGAARVVRRVAEALDYLHRCGIIHRDIKPSNILIDEDGQPLLTDFGIARILGQDHHTRTGAILGTPSYMSPEQAAGRLETMDARSDVYSLGVILYELLTGVPPFEARNPLDTLVQILEREPEAPRRLERRIPRDLELICLKCLEKAPENRYATAAELAEDLERFVAGEPVEARPAGAAHRFGRWLRREPPLAVRLIGIGVFYFVELINYYLLGAVTAGFHLRVSLVVLVWVLGSILLQKLLNRGRWAERVVFAWGGLDVAAVTYILFIGAGAASPLVVVYPLMVAASGLWFRVGFVWFTTTAGVLSYLSLVGDFYLRRVELQTGFDAGWDRHVFFVIMLLVVGGAVAYQVHRAQALGRYYASRRARSSSGSAAAYRGPGRSGPGRS